MSENEFDQHERAVWEALARLEDPATAFEGPLPDDEIRAHVELLGLLPLALVPEAPRASLRGEILGRIAGRGSTPTAPSASAPEPSPADKGADVVRFPAPPPRVAPPHVDRPPAFLRWAAAALAVCLLGLGYLFGKTQEQSATIARLEEDLRSNQIQGGVAQLTSADFERLERRFKMVTEIARSAYPMHRVKHGAAVGDEEQMNGTVFVCGQHQRWYMNVRGLEPPPPDHEYHLWFVTDDGMIDGGAVEFDGDTAELDAPRMPRGTHGFALTLETVGAHAEPEGELVLIADRSVSL